jgi:RHS repeat-associated protein
MADIVGTSRRLLSETATVTDTYSLDAFGRQMSASGSTVNPYRFGAAWGYIADTPGSGLLQLGARFYWPEVGRFIQQDPAGDGMNWYAYVENSPVVWMDPDGLRRRRGVRQWLRDQGRAIQDAINGLGHMLIAPFSMDPANLPTFSQRNPGLGDLQQCIGRGDGFDPTVAFGELANAGIGAGFAAFGGMVAEEAGSLRFTPQQEYLVDLAQHYSKTGISAGDAEALMQLAEEAGLQVGNHIDSTHWVGGPHIRIGPIRHIPVRAR